MQELLAQVTEIAKRLHEKNQVNIAAGNLDPLSYECAQELSRSSLIGLFAMISIDRDISEAIVDVEIIRSRKADH